MTDPARGGGTVSGKPHPRIPLHHVLIATEPSTPSEYLQQRRESAATVWYDVALPLSTQDLVDDKDESGTVLIPSGTTVLNDDQSVHRAPAAASKTIPYRKTQASALREVHDNTEVELYRSTTNRGLRAMTTALHHLGVSIRVLEGLPLQCRPLCSLFCSSEGRMVSTSSELSIFSYEVHVCIKCK